MTHIPRVVITGVTLSGQDIVDRFDNNPNYVTIWQVIEDLPYSLTPTQAVTLRCEAVAVLNERRQKART
jgi:hypothetical protein